MKISPQVFEIIFFKCTDKDRYVLLLRWSRVFRPLVVFKLFDYIFNIQVSSSEFQMIYMKVKNQLKNVTIFFLFVSTFFSILGIQIFNKPEHRCFATKNAENATIRDLAVPDQICSNDPNYGNQCPTNMFCNELKEVKSVHLEYQYDNLVNAFFTVYKAASQEEWSVLMYDAMDQMPAWQPISFYISLIFFLSIIVKNLFIAVITQTFEMIRSHHFQHFWTSASSRAELVNEVLNNSFKIDKNWNLIEVHESEFKRHYVLRKLNQLFQSTFYNYIVLTQIICESIVISSIDFNDSSGLHKEFQFFAEIILTFLFVADVLLKMLTYGYKSYLRESIHKFELVLAIGCLVNLVPSINHFAYFISFKVMRIIRLIRVSPILENFIRRVFGGSKKLGVIIVFTAIILIIISAISLQLFCTIELYSNFSTFTYSFISVFSLMTQEGWIKLMDDTKSKVDNEFLSLLISVWFVVVHLFLSLVVLSLFVGIILDQLEDSEELKKFMQDNMRKQIEFKENKRLPFRLRFYELFKWQPAMIKLRKTANQFETPKLKATFMKEYLNQTDTELDMKHLLKERSGDFGGHCKAYNLNDLEVCRQLDLGRSETENPSIKLIGTYHPCKSRIRRHQDKMIQLEQLMSLSKRRTENENEEFSKQIELLGDRWRELPSSSVLKGRRKSIRFDEAALNESSDQQLLGGKYEVKQRATSKALVLLKNYLDQRSENSAKNQLKSLEENHPLLDRSLFFIKKSNWLRRKCVAITEFKLSLRELIESSDLLHDKLSVFKRYSFFRRQFGKLNNLIYNLPVIDWIGILVTLICCSTLILENPNYSILNSSELVSVEIFFILTLLADLTLKLIANGLFTPDSRLFNLWFLIDSIVLVNSMLLLLLQQLGFEIPLIVLIVRCLRPLRFFSLIPNMQRVTSELLKGFKEYVLVSFILFFFLFIFATFALLLFGGKLKRCNDYQKRPDEDCNGLVVKSVKVTNLKFRDPDRNVPYRLLVPMHRSNPRNFDFDDIFSSFLALFEVGDLINVIIN